ncbi:hypothetical protein FPQ18DRAFT_91349 [Pyronema domesticum]|nr:hypothetical protein FPQ18DRAFT_91349 [Pyronema domesticum]
MNRLTNFFNASDTRLNIQRNAPPTPPLGPDIGYASLGGRPRDPKLFLDTAANGNASSRLQPADRSNTFGEYSQGLLTPTSGSSPNLLPQRPGTSSGYSNISVGGSALASAPVLELPRLKNKKSSRWNKKNSEEATTLAWVLQGPNSQQTIPYDINPLAKGERAKELWIPGGDTLVYLTSQDNPNPKYKEPVFRINASSLLFATMNDFLVDVNCEVRPPKSASVNADQQNAPTDLFLDVPSKYSPSIPQVENDARSQMSAAASQAGSTSDEHATISRVNSCGIRTVNDDTDIPEPQSAVIVEAGDEDEDDEHEIMYRVYFPLIEDDESAPVTEKDAAKKLKKKGKSAAVPDAGDRLQRLIDTRNLFAFIAKAPLVASQKKSLPFDIFSKIFNMLNAHVGDTQKKIASAELHLQHYIDELALADVRGEDDAIIEALVMGEQWHSVRLYHEGFIHAAGKWEDIVDVHPGLGMVSQTTISRLDRCHLDLHQIRLVNVKNRLPNFEFPSVWVGEGRYKDYAGWRVGYDKLRSLVMNHMKWVFGAWPPRPERVGKGGGHSKTGGLNRVVLKRLYDDVCAIYDILVDREWLHGERIHFDAAETEENEEAKEKNEKYRKVLRNIQREFDQSSVPIQPDMPFDMPRVPARLASSKKSKKTGLFSRFSKKFKAEEINEIFQNSYNRDSLQQHAENPLVKAFVDMEREYANGKSIEEMAAARRGAWIFMYCVLQSCVLVVVDGQGLQYGDGCEYFLCENVKGTPPWEKGANRRQTRMSTMWATGPVGMGSGFLTPSALSSMVNLGINPDDEIEMTYRASHCWQVAEAWRLVENDDEDDEDDIYGYLQNYGQQDGPGSTSGYSNEYIPGLQVPQSPQLGAGEYSGFGFNQRPKTSPELPSGRSTPSIAPNMSLPLPTERAESGMNPRFTLAPINTAPFDFSLPGPAESLKGSPSQSRSASPMGGAPPRPAVQPQRTWSPGAGAASPTLGPTRKFSMPVSGTSSPLRYSPSNSGQPSQYSAYSTPERRNSTSPPRSNSTTPELKNLTVAPPPPGNAPPPPPTSMLAV